MLEIAMKLPPGALIGGDDRLLAQAVLATGGARFVARESDILWTNGRITGWRESNLAVEAVAAGPNTGNSRFEAGPPGALICQDGVNCGFTLPGFASEVEAFTIAVIYQSEGEAGTLASVVVTSQDNAIELGGGTQAMVAGRDAGGGTVALGNRTVSWTTSNPSIATISSEGFATGVGIGNVNLQVTVQDGATTRTGTVPLTVTAVAGAPATATVEMLPDRFLPYEIVLRQNGSVNFIFPALAHNVIWERVRAGAPTDIAATSSVTVSRTFPTVGVFDYVCTLHTGMIGKIIVTP